VSLLNDSIHSVEHGLMAQSFDLIVATLAGEGNAVKFIAITVAPLFSVHPSESIISPAAVQFCFAFDDPDFEKSDLEFGFDLIPLLRFSPDLLHGFSRLE
jgi:hypothetical protein